MDITTTIKMHNDVKIPQLGFGVFQAHDHVAKQAVLWALEAGYRHIDTAAAYNNEQAVGDAIRESGLAREEIFVTTKLWNDDQRAHRQRAAFEESLSKLGLDYVDLYLIHWPVKDCYLESWQVLETLYAEGKTRSIGVSNFRSHHIEEVLHAGQLAPHVNQLEFNPGNQDNDTLAFCREKGIVFEAWSPLGNGKYTSDETIAAIAARYDKTVAQVILRWILQKGIVVFPKSVHKERIIQNTQLFDFALIDREMAILDAMNTNTPCIGSSPENFDF